MNDQSSHPEAWRQSAVREEAAGHFDIADAILAAATSKFPGDFGVLVDWAKIAARRRDWRLEETIWRDVMVYHPGGPWWMWTSLGWNLYRQDRHSEALPIWEEARSRFPNETFLYIAHIRALIEARLSDELPRVIRTALETVTGWTDANLIEFGNAALSCQSTALATRCAELLCDHPSSPAAGRFISAWQNAIAETEAAIEIQTASNTNFLMRFESLGGDYPGCEIGLVQRQFGAEPLGLLRWTTTAPDALTDALRCGFEGVGSAEQTLLYDHLGSYKTRDRRFGMDMLTFVKTSSIDEVQIFNRCCRRIQFLRNKMLADLVSDEKIFVYRTFDDILPMERLQAINAAMSCHGKNRLLYVGLARDGVRSGAIEHMAEDLIIGRVGQFSKNPTTELFLDGWMDVFTAVNEIWSGN